MTTIGNASALRAAVRAVLLAAVVTGAAAAAYCSTGEDLLAGCEALYRGEWAAAEAAFTRAAAGDGDCAEALVGQGAAALQLGRTAEAARLFEQAAVIAPELAAAHAGLAACRHVGGDDYAAMIAYRRALGLAQARRAELRASAGWAACRLGLYESALAEARSAMAESPDDPLARHVAGAALIGLNRAEEAVAALGRPAAFSHGATPGVLAVPSALLSPGAKYWADNGLDERVRLAEAPHHVLEQPAVYEPTPEPAPTPSDQPEEFAIIRPKPGEIVSGMIEVAVETDGTISIDHIAVLLDDRFMAISNVRPFRARVETRQIADGARELRVEGYAESGAVVASTAITIRVANGSMTLAPSERDARRRAREELAALLSLRATPLTNAQLLGRALQLAGRPAEAIASLEYVFGHDPMLPGVRADLLLAYRDFGLPALDGSREVFILDTPGAVALTFDDGPHPVMTPRILDLLDRYDYRATFFLVGKQATMYPGLVREIVERGHEIGSHSQTHCNLCTLSRLGVEQELVRSRAAIRQACGRMVTLFRPPGGNYDARVRSAAAATGFTTVFWNENIGNYPGREGPEIADSMAEKLSNGGIVLLHNGYDETQYALPHLLDRLDAMGVRCDTISALTNG